MRDVVVVLTYDRPKMLSLCLEKISACLCEDKEIWVCDDDRSTNPKDRSVKDKIKNVLALYPGVKHIERSHNKPVPPGLWRGGFNMWESLQEAARRDPKYIYMILDDVLVTKDFFKWSEEVHGRFFPFITYGSKNYKGSDPAACIRSNRLFSDWGVCITPTNFRRFNLKTNEHRGMDEVLHQWMLDNKEFAISPQVARAFHYGWPITHPGFRPFQESQYTGPLHLIENQFSYTPYSLARDDDQ
jgi:hypothetical protein